MKLHRHLPHLGATLGVLLLFGLFFPKLLHSPNSYLLSAEGDGIAANYNLVSHVAHDTAALRASYFNYPYGENLLLVDAQPAVAVALQGVHAVWPGVASYLVGLYTGLIVLSFVLGGVATAALLARMSLAPWQAALGGVLLVAMCPQMYRLEGHLNLAYMAAVPVCFYLLWRFLDAPTARARWAWTTLLVANGIFWALVHGYFVLLTSGLLLGFWAVWPLTGNKKQETGSKQRWGILPYLLHAAVQALVPLAVFGSLVRAMDHLTQRGTYFGDILCYAATPRSTFSPAEGPLRWAYQKLFRLQAPSEWEGWAFVGTTSLLVALGLVGYGLWCWAARMRSKPKPTGTPSSPNVSEKSEWIRRYLLSLVLGGLLLALFAMALPFRLKWVEDAVLTDTSPLRQFRALGRFNWALVYAAVLAGVYVLFQWTNRLRAAGGRRRVWLVVPTLLLTLYAVEGGALWRKVGSRVPKGPNWFRPDVLADSAPDILQLVRVTDSLGGAQAFQALVPLPFFYANGVPGSSVPSDHAVRQAMILSYYTGLPLVGGLPSRASYVACRNSYGLFLPPYAAKAILADLPNARPLLVLDVHCPRTGEWGRFWATAPLRPLATLPSGVRLYALYPKDLAPHGPATARNLWQQDEPRLALMPGGLWADSTQVRPDSLPVFYNGFDEQQAVGPDSMFRGTGAQVLRAKDLHVIFDPAAHNLHLPQGREYCFSFWIKLTDRQQFDVAVFVETPDGWCFVNEARKCTVSRNGWCLYEVFYTLPPPDKFYRLALCGNEKTPGHLALDELWVYPADQRVYRRPPAGPVELNNLAVD